MSKPLTWTQLNDKLRTTKDEKVCEKLMLAECDGLNRKLFKRRIYGKFSKLRATRERKIFKI